VHERLSAQGREALRLAEEEARAMGHEYLGTEHLLLGLLDQRSTPAAGVLSSLGVDARHVQAEITRTVGPGEREVTGTIPLTPLAEKALQRTVEEADAAGQDQAGDEQLLLGVAGESNGLAARILLRLDVSLEQIRAGLASRSEAADGQS
jgi:ATP-dependent Clp protease ATP-binding subunit ClpC